MADLNPLNWNWNQYKAAGRHVASYAAGGVSVAVALHLLSPAQGSDIAENIGTITDGLMKVATGIGGLIAVLAPIYTAFKAAHSASPVQEAKALEKAVPGTKIITDPKIADAVPSPNVMPNTEVKVVPK